MLGCVDAVAASSTNSESSFCHLSGQCRPLLSAGGGLDVVGLHAWTLSADTVEAVISNYPRRGFKREFVAAFRTEAVCVPAGRAAFLRRFGAFGLAIRLAPFRG